MKTQRTIWLFLFGMSAASGPEDEESNVYDGTMTVTVTYDGSQACCEMLKSPAHLMAQRSDSSLPKSLRPVSGHS